jgi:hypothetical protein
MALIFVSFCFNQELLRSCKSCCVHAARGTLRASAPLRPRALFNRGRRIPAFVPLGGFDVQAVDQRTCTLPRPCVGRYWAIYGVVDFKPQ